MRESRRIDSIWSSKSGQYKHLEILILTVDILYISVSARREEDAGMDSGAKGTVEHAQGARIPKIHHFKSDLLPGALECVRSDHR